MPPRSGSCGNWPPPRIEFPGVLQKLAQIRGGLLHGIRRKEKFPGEIVNLHMAAHLFDCNLHENRLLFCFSGISIQEVVSHKRDYEKKDAKKNRFLLGKKTVFLSLTVFLQLDLLTGCHKQPAGALELLGRLPVIQGAGL